MKNIALLLASGTGSRCGLDYPKQFAKIGDKTILELSIDNFESHELIDEIIIVTNAEYVEKVKELTQTYIKVSNVVAGGVTRKDSSFNGISQIKYDPSDYDDERFLLYMDDDNLVYITLYKFTNINKYNEIVKNFGNKRGIIYLDSGNYFEIKEN